MYAVCMSVINKEDTYWECGGFPYCIVLRNWVDFKFCNDFP